ncbi:MAG: TIGR04372 family glycosyltransferase [Vicinamibacterales bacterium]|nr:TIGR04372 family glycosyltransferase [Vicinamibacterales bacterium]
MDARFIRAPFRRTLVSRPRHHALGLLIVDVLISLHLARVKRAPLVFLRGEQGEDSPMLHLVAEDVSLVDNRVVRTRAASRAWTWLMAAARFKDGLLSPRPHLVNGSLVVLDAACAALAVAAHAMRLRDGWNTVVRRVLAWLDAPHAKKTSLRVRWGHALWDRLDRWQVAKQSREGEFRERILKFRARLSARLDVSRRSIPPARQVHHGYDVRRLCLEQPLRVGFQAEDEARAREAAGALGLLDRPLVTLHVRDGGSKRDASTGGFARDVSRDARIESYLPAIDLLVSRGYTVARIGDPEMSPIQHTGLVDVATHPGHDLLLDLWCVRNSRFFIAGDSGPYMLSWLFNVPCLAANITNVLGVFPLRPEDVCLIKIVEEVQTSRAIPLSEMLTSEFLATLRRRIAKEGALRYVDNDAQDICAAVREMDDGLQHPRPETPLQRSYRHRIEEIRNGPLVRAKLSEKIGSGEVLLGKGRVAHAFAERHFGVAQPEQGPA